MHHRDARRDGAHRAGDVISQADHPAGPDTWRRFQFVHGNDRAGAHFANAAAHAEIFQHAFQQPRILFQRGRIDARTRRRGRRRQQVETR